MKNLRLRVIALLLALMVLLTGCSWRNDSLRLWYTSLTGDLPLVKFADMPYVRPDIGQLLDYREKCVTLARDGTDFDALEENIWKLYDEYYNFSTQYALADIYFSGDLTDPYWQEEYNWCMETAVEVDAAMEDLFFALADSVFRDALERDDLFGQGFFDGYQGESVWDPEFIAMMEKETAMLEQYYELIQRLYERQKGTEEYDAAAMELAELYADLVELRQRQATYSGYANYLNFAYTFYYDRDYSPKLEELYLSQIQANLVPLYRKIYTSETYAVYEMVTEQETFQYLKTAAKEMGGTVWKAFKLLEQGGLYDISYGENKYQASFEVMLMNYYEPFIFMAPAENSYDLLTFAHEFGHFCGDYASYGALVGVDGAEVQSQGMEYLSLLYGEDTRALTRLKMVDSLCTYVEQAAYAAFEQAVYKLHPDDLTGENIMALFQEITDSFGFDIWDENPNEFVTIGHFFTDPLYIFSYVVSNDAAMQIYQKELEKPGAGLALYEACLTSSETDFLAFLASAGLHSPFTHGRLAEVKETFESILG